MTESELVMFIGPMPHIPTSWWGFSISDDHSMNIWELVIEPHLKNQLGTSGATCSVTALDLSTGSTGSTGPNELPLNFSWESHTMLQWQPTTIIYRHLPPTFHLAYLPQGAYAKFDYTNGSAKGFFDLHVTSGWRSHLPQVVFDHPLSNQTILSIRIYPYGSQYYLCNWECTSPPKSTPRNHLNQPPDASLALRLNTSSWGIFETTQLFQLSRFNLCPGCWTPNTLPQLQLVAGPEAS